MPRAAGRRAAPSLFASEEDRRFVDALARLVTCNPFLPERIEFERLALGKEFVPVDEVPQGEQIPAINLVAAAYGFVWVAVLGYVWSIARRLQHVESELADLESRRK